LGNAVKYTKVQVKLLIDNLGQFLNLCADGLALNKNLIGPDQAFFHSQLEQGYAEIRTEINKYIDTALNTNWDVELTISNSQDSLHNSSEGTSDIEDAPPEYSQALQERQEANVKKRTLKKKSKKLAELPPAYDQDYYDPPPPFPGLSLNLAAVGIPLGGLETTSGQILTAEMITPRSYHIKESKQAAEQQQKQQREAELSRTADEIAIMLQFKKQDLSKMVPNELPPPPPPVDGPQTLPDLPPPPPFTADNSEDNLEEKERRKNDTMRALKQQQQARLTLRRNANNE
jgi:hypothetical protein